MRTEWLCGLDRLITDLVSAINGEQTESGVHYLLSDAVYEFLSELCGDLSARLDDSSGLIDSANRGKRPRDLLTVSQWADKNRMLSTGTNLPGKWRTDVTPYLREIQDSLSEHSPVRIVSFKKSSGVGGTEVLFNWVGYVADHVCRFDMMITVPTQELRDRSLNPRLNKMLTETPSLKEKVTTASRNKSNRAEVLEIGPIRLVRMGANSSDSMRMDHLPYSARDEVDAYPWDVGGEGDPDSLLDNRQRTFSRAKTYNVSTPTIEGLSRISRQYRRSDQRRYHVPCPHCGNHQTLDWKQLKFKTTPIAGQDGVPESERQQIVSDAWYECSKCRKRIDEGHKTNMLAEGRWIPERPNVKLHRGYHINALYAPIGLGLTWKDVAQKWLDAQDDTAELKTFVNTYLGEEWREQGDDIEDLSLISRLEDYPESLRERVELRTSFTDIQKDRLETTIIDWLAEEECWVLDHIITPGDTATDAPYLQLTEELNDAGVDIGGIDTGFQTTMAYAFCRAHPWIIPTKGMGGMGRPLVEDEKKRRQTLRRKRKSGVHPEIIGVDGGKALLYARLRHSSPGPGYVHFVRNPMLDDEYFAQVAAEKLVIKTRGTRPFHEWIQVRPRNEALDCLVGNLCVRRLASTWRRRRYGSNRVGENAQATDFKVF